MSLEVTGVLGNPTSRVIGSYILIWIYESHIRSNNKIFNNNIKSGFTIFTLLRDFIISSKILLFTMPIR
jgi:hypothetical protein